MVSRPEETPPRADASNSQNVFNRLVRTMSSRSVANDNIAASPAVTTQATETRINQASEITQGATSVSSQTQNKRRLSIGEKLKKLTQDLWLRGRTKATLSSPEITTGDVSGVTISNESELEQVHHARMLSVVMELAEGHDPPPNQPSSSTGPVAPSLSPSAFAKHLRDLIDPLPFPTFSTPITPPKLPQRDKKGWPISPPTATPISDSKLIALLSSATYMNGSKAGDKSRPSVWNLLENLGVPPHGLPPTEEQPLEQDGTERRGEDGTDQPGSNDPGFFSGTSSVMVYSPLIPGNEDLVELGELLPVSYQEEVVHDASAATSWTSIWPISLISGWTQFGIQTAVMETPTHSFSGDFLVSSDVTTVNSTGKTVRVKTTSAWVPSTTKLSFQAMWWGYRLWLPPPVMAILSDHTLEAAKRATLIATALAWFFNNLPVNLFPLPVRPALLIMQRIVPYLGYIATFISWSWGTIKTYDLGFGVTLTATWLLPIALVPGTWFERDVPKSPSQKPPTDLPSSPAPTNPPVPTPASPPQIPVDPPTGTPISPPSTMPTPSQSQSPSQPTPQLPSLPTPQPPEQSPQPLVTSPGLVTIPANPPVQQPTNPAPDTGVTVLPIPPGPSVPDSSPVSSTKMLAKKLFSLSPANAVSLPVSAESPKTPPLSVPRTPVVVNSHLSEELLHAPVLRPVPLPDENTQTAVVAEKKVKHKDKTKTIFTHIGKRT